MKQHPWMSAALLLVCHIAVSARAEFIYRDPSYGYPPPPASAARPKHVAPHPSISPLLWAEERVFVRPQRDFIVPPGKYFSPDYFYSSDPTQNLERKSMVCHALSTELHTELGWTPRRLSRDRWYAIEDAKVMSKKLYFNLKAVGPDRPGDLPGNVGMFCYTNCTKKTGDPLQDLLGCRTIPTPAELACAFDLKVAVPAEESGVALVCPFRYATRQP